jgi:predicted DNA binding CopG/RHH family protein
MKALKKIPEFKNEDEEREFWAKNDSSEYLDWGKSERMVFPNLKPSSKTISLRLPEYILDEIKMLARKRDVPYQSLIKVYLKERVDQELNQLR